MDKSAINKLSLKDIEINKQPISKTTKKRSYSTKASNSGLESIDNDLTPEDLNKISSQSTR